ncbi:SNF2-related protein [Kitasatospora sp. NPDC058048]|uniref:SNF2-related protein n=1 Tax=Kitasatospora sp. NPDC058048 TaxID=3346313 RepID=UPI0036DF7185
MDTPRRSPDELPDLLVNHLPGRTVASDLATWLTSSTASVRRLTVVTSFVSLSGLLTVVGPLRRLVARGVGVRLLIGTEQREQAEIIWPDDPLPYPQPTPELRRQDLLLHASVNGANLTGERALCLGDLADLLSDPRVECRRYEADFLHAKLVVRHGDIVSAVIGSSNWTAPGLRRSIEINAKLPQGTSLQAATVADRLWDRAQPYDLAAAITPLFAAHPIELVYLQMLLHRYGEQVNAPPSPLHLEPYQRDGLAQLLTICRRHGGALLADTVGLGKTYIAGECISHAAANRAQDPFLPRGPVLVVTPAAVKETWLDHLGRWGLNPDVVTYNQLTSTYDAIQAGTAAWRDYGLIVCDEAHALRNPRRKRNEALRSLLAAAKTRPWLILLTATPVNNDTGDLWELLVLADADLEPGWKPTRTFSPARTRRLPPASRPLSAALRNLLDLTPLELHHLHRELDHRLVRRDWHFIEHAYHDTLHGITRPVLYTHAVRYHLTGAQQGLLTLLVDALIGDSHLDRSDRRALRRLRGPTPTPASRPLSMAAYNLDRYLLVPTWRMETSIAGLIRAMVLKRFESSLAALASTTGVMERRCRRTLADLEHGGVQIPGKRLTAEIRAGLTEPDETTDPDSLLTLITAQGHDLVHVSAGDLDTTALRTDLQADAALLGRIARTARDLIPTDPKRDSILRCLHESAADPHSPKVVVFSSSRVTINDLAHWLIPRIDTDPKLAAYRGRTAVVGADKPLSRQGLAKILSRFCPRTAALGPTRAGRPAPRDDYDLLLCTDVLSEGINLQEAAYCINYDLTWNPERMGQRAGRLQRLGSSHLTVTCWTVLPDHGIDLVLHIMDLILDKARIAAALVGIDDRLFPGCPRQPRTFTRLLRQIRGDDESPYRPVFTDQARAWLGNALRSLAADRIRAGGTPSAVHPDRTRPRGVLYCFTHQPTPENPHTAAFARITETGHGPACSTDTARCLEEASVDPTTWMANPTVIAPNPIRAPENNLVFRHLDQARRHAAEQTGIPPSAALDALRLTNWIVYPGPTSTGT